MLPVGGAACHLAILEGPTSICCTVAIRDYCFFFFFLTKILIDNKNILNYYSLKIDHKLDTGLDILVSLKM